MAIREALLMLSCSLAVVFDDRWGYPTVWTAQYISTFKYKLSWAVEVSRQLVHGTGGLPRSMIKHVIGERLTVSGGAVLLLRHASGCAPSSCMIPLSTKSKILGV